MKEILKCIISNLVDDKDSVEINQIDEETRLLLEK